MFHRWYTGVNGIEDEKYIPEDFFYHKILKHYNDLDLVKAYSDKSMYKKMFPNILQPETVVMNVNGMFYDENYNLINLEKASELVKRMNSYVIKPTIDSGGGKNVKIVHNDIEQKYNIEKIFNEYKKDFIIQKPLKQCKELEDIHKKSINTIRVISMLENGKVTILSSVLRMGIDDSFVDNESSGGINCGINDDGTLSDKAYDASGKIYNKHPQGFEFKNGIVPSYNEIINIIKKEHMKLPYFGLISWDFAINQEEEPIMIEINLSWEGLNFHQLHHGPLFGGRTTEILQKVIQKSERI